MRKKLSEDMAAKILKNLDQQTAATGMCTFSNVPDDHPFATICKGAVTAKITCAWLLDSNVPESEWGLLLDKPICGGCYASVLLAKSSLKSKPRHIAHELHDCSHRHKPGEHCSSKHSEEIPKMEDLTEAERLYFSSLTNLWIPFRCILYSENSHQQFNKHCQKTTLRKDRETPQSKILGLEDFLLLGLSCSSPFDFGTPYLLFMSEKNFQKCD